MKFITPFTIALMALVWPLASRAGDAGTTGAPIYYLTERVSITNDSGILNLVPGTKLLLISKVQDGIEAKTEDGMVVQVKLSQVTTDPDVAATLTKQDAANISAQQAAAAAATQAAADQQRQADMKRQQALDQIAAVSHASASATPFKPLPGAALDNPPPATYKLKLPPKKKKK